MKWIFIGVLFCYFGFQDQFFPYGQRLTLKKSEVEDQKSTKGKKMRQGREKKSKR